MRALVFMSLSAAAEVNVECAPRRTGKTRMKLAKRSERTASVRNGGRSTVTSRPTVTRRSWPGNAADAIVAQRELAKSVVLAPAPLPARIVGLDCAFAGDDILAVAVVWDTGERSVVEARALRMRVEFPYVPGLLSYREVPALLKVLARVRAGYQGVLCDGQGIAHPRRCGLAAHLGLMLDMPSVGCAKSRLFGHFEAPGSLRGDGSPLYDERPAGTEPERIGTVLRTRDRVNPLFVSPGHRTDHPSSVAWVLACGGGYRMPEPTRLADRLVAAYKQTGRLPKQVPRVKTRSKDGG
jgi:deoxyribonuclease V